MDNAIKPFQAGSIDGSRIGIPTNLAGGGLLPD
jgi:hypothetical protein